MPLWRSLEQFVWFWFLHRFKCCGRAAGKSCHPGYRTGSLWCSPAWQWHCPGSSVAEWGAMSLVSHWGIQGLSPWPWCTAQSAGSLFLHAAFFASSHFKVRAGAAELLEGKESAEREEGRGIRVVTESKCFAGRNADSAQHNDSPCMNTSCLSTIQWSLGKVPLNNTIFCQLTCFRTLVLILLKLNCHFPLDRKFSWCIPHAHTKKTLLFYVCGNSPQSRNLCFLLVLWVWSSHAMPTLLLGHLW